MLILILPAVLYSQEEDSYFDSQRSGKNQQTPNPTDRTSESDQDDPDQQSLDVPNRGMDQKSKDKTRQTIPADSAFSYTGFIRETLHGAQSTLPESQRIRKELLSSQTRLRLEAAYNDPEDVWQAQASGNADFVFTNYMDSVEFDLYWKNRSRNRLFSMEKINDEDEFMTSLDVHRLWFSWSNARLDLKLGRQVLSWGQGRLINPMDLITPSGPFLLDIEDVPGADILSGLYSINSTDIVEVVLSPNKRSDNTDLSKLDKDDSNFLLRYKSTYDALDLAIVSGYHYRTMVFGTEATLTVWDAGLRMAWLARDEGKLSDLPYYQNENLPHQTTHQGTLGISYAFWGKLQTNLELLLNSGYYANDPALKSHLEQESLVRYGFAKPDANDSSFYRTAGRVITKNPYLIQFSLAYELSEVWNIQFVGIYDHEGKSYFAAPSISYSFSEEGVWMLGAQFFEDYGPKGTGEFEGQPPSVYTFARLHF